MNATTITEKRLEKKISLWDIQSYLTNKEYGRAWEHLESVLKKAARSWKTKKSAPRIMRQERAR